MKTTKFILSLMTVCLFTLNMNGQNKFTGMNVSIGDGITGNSFGGIIDPSLDLNFQKSTFSLGLNVQQERMNVSGLQGTYRYQLTTSYNQKVSLFVFGNMSYNHSGSLCKKTVDYEERRSILKHRESESLDYSNMKLRTIELYTGFGLNIKHTQRLNSLWMIGIGGYQTLGSYDRCNIDREKGCLSLNLKVGISYNLFNR